MTVPVVNDVRKFPLNCPLSLVGNKPVSLGDGVGANMAISGAKVDKKSAVQVRKDE